MNGAPSLDKLIACLSKLPGTGRRSAERMAMKLVRNPDTLLRELIVALEDASRNARCCSRCGSVTSAAEDPCRLCLSPNRDGALLCVVEEPADIAVLERSGAFRGRYHALMGKLSPMKGTGMDDIRIRSLLSRVAEDKFQEVVLALSTDVEGDSTASLLAHLLRERNVKVSRLAFGLPSGSGVLYSDPVTLARAMKGRQEA